MNIRAEKMGLDPEKLRQFLAQQMEEQKPSPQPEAAGSSTDPPIEPDTVPIEFDLKPEELESYLDQFVIRQHEAKAVLATKICTHFNRLKLAPDEDDDIIGNIKNNVLLIGPTGVGKTYLIKLIARKIGVPFVKGDATKFSETGYVGGDVEDLVRELVREADGDIGRAEQGIIYIDEIDKIASSRGQQGPDVSRSGVQRNLLKLMEETEVELKAPHDIASQMEAVMQMQQTGKVEREKVNTRNILFIVSGAFAGLDEIISRRLNLGSIGFQLNDNEQKDEIPAQELFQHVRADDLMEYGFESEFIGRLPVLAVLHPLEKRDLLAILRSPKSSVLLAKKRDFRAYGIATEFTDTALEILATRAHEERTGARSLVGAIEKALLPFEKKLPSSSVDHFVVDEEVINEPEKALDRLLRSSSLSQFRRDFLEKHGIELFFSTAAETLLVQLAAEKEQTPDAVCDTLFADYGHGLKLAGLNEFTLSEEAVRNPQEALNQLIKEYYNRQTT
ncbi:MAG: ATP-dependent Clp protease ATP-binding subunit ClpX [Candidatus Latescibacterota bacterium]|jgi:ATP-dependent Clp protease ATP-binding subunit ClpX